MQLLELTLPTPEENLALDEALLDEAEAGAADDETLRLWAPLAPLVVIGRSSRVEVEVDQAACAKWNVPVRRRISGGAAIVTGPGCLMYAVLLSYQRRPELRAVDAAHRFVLGTLLAGLRRHAPTVGCRGTSDLALGERKFSGNSVRCRRGWLLYHGTLLYGFPLEWIARLLRTPPRQPAYRAARSHDEFVANLPLPLETLRAALVDAWRADVVRSAWPQAAVERLAAERYSQAEWNLGRDAEPRSTATRLGGDGGDGS